MNWLTDFINKYKQSNPTGWRKWVVGFFVIIAIVIVTAGYAIIATVRGRQIAGLQTQRDVAQEAVHQAEVNQRLATYAQAQQQHAQAAEQARQQVAVIQQQLDALQQTHEQNQAVIAGLHSWGDVDRTVK